MASTPPGLKTPKQKRSLGTLDRIVASAQGLIADRGAESVTLREVLDRAEVSVGAFYNLFAGKEALLQYLERQFWIEAGAGWDAFLSPDRWKTASLEALVGEITRVLVLTYVRDREKLREFLLFTLTGEGRGGEEVVSLDRYLRRRIVPLVMERMGEEEDATGPAGTAVRERTVTRAFRNVMAMLRDRVLLSGTELGIDSEDERELTEELTRLFLASLQADQ